MWEARKSVKTVHCKTGENPSICTFYFPSSGTEQSLLNRIWHSAFSTWWNWSESFLFAAGVEKGKCEQYASVPQCVTWIMCLHQLNRSNPVCTQCALWITRKLLTGRLQWRHPGIQFPGKPLLIDTVILSLSYTMICLLLPPAPSLCSGKTKPDIHKFTLTRCFPCTVSRYNNFRISDKQIYHMGLLLDVFCWQVDTKSQSPRIIILLEVCSFSFQAYVLTCSLSLPTERMPTRVLVCLSHFFTV